ncbi:MAG: hypothetical protein INQ03_05835 [Candidatus Heimdallarchaeota archaeon]|nr:hypothetical protein [Candidatus Heimdallarchaeota archaeon]
MSGIQVDITNLNKGEVVYSNCIAMLVEVREGLFGNKVFLYSREIDLNNIPDNIDQKEMMKNIQEIVKQFAKSRLFTENHFYVWDRATPKLIRLVKRSFDELSDKEIEDEERRFDEFESSVRKELIKVTAT